MNPNYLFPSDETREVGISRFIDKQSFFLCYYLLLYYIIFSYEQQWTYFCPPLPYILKEAEFFRKWLNGPLQHFQ